MKKSIIFLTLIFPAFVFSSCTIYMTERPYTPASYQDFSTIDNTITLKFINNKYYFYKNDKSIAVWTINNKGRIIRNGSKIDGLVKKYFPNGKIEWEIAYKNNVPDGLYKLYYNNGKIKETGRFDKGEKTGYFYLYGHNGKLVKKGWYNKDKEPRITYADNSVVPAKGESIKGDMPDGAYGYSAPGAKASVKIAEAMVQASIDHKGTFGKTLSKFVQAEQGARVVGNSGTGPDGAGNNTDPQGNAYGKDKDKGENESNGNGNAYGKDKAKDDPQGNEYGKDNDKGESKSGSESNAYGKDKDNNGKVYGVYKTKEEKDNKINKQVKGKWGSDVMKKIEKMYGEIEDEDENEDKDKNKGASVEEKGNKPDKNKNNKK